MSAEELTCCLLALGWICDQREYLSEIDSNIIHNVLDTIRNLDYYYSIFITKRQEKAKGIVIKMVNGERLNVDEEQFLLTKLEL